MIFDKEKDFNEITSKETFYGVYDAVAYSKLLGDVIGPDRNACQFAREIDVAPSTITRILNQENKRASSREVLERMAKHAAPSSSVTLNALLKANGLPLEVDIEELYGIVALQQALNSLDAFEYEVSESRVSCENGLEDWKEDFCIKTKKAGVWIFDMMSAVSLIDKFPYELNHKVLYEQKLQQFLANIYLKSTLDEELVGKYSMVVGEEENYEYLAEKMKRIKAEKCISVIYLKREEMKLKKGSCKEQCCRNCNGEFYDSIWDS